MPTAKLAALQKVLQSDFFSAVRDVYEHVYETVDLAGSPDVRASATAKVRLGSCVKKLAVVLFYSRVLNEPFLVKCYPRNR